MKGQLIAYRVMSIADLTTMESLKKQEAHGPYRSPEYQRLNTDFQSEGLIFTHQQPHRRIKTNNGRGKLQYYLFIQQESIRTSSKLSFCVCLNHHPKQRRSFKRMHFHYKTFMATSWLNTPCPGGGGDDRARTTNCKIGSVDLSKNENG